jgi:Ca2+/Na+ antiporter
MGLGSLLGTEFFEYLGIMGITMISTKESMSIDPWLFMRDSLLNLLLIVVIIVFMLLQY